MLKDLKKESKTLNDVRKDTGYMVYEEAMDELRIPIDWFMSWPYVNLD